MSEGVGTPPDVRTAPANVGERTLQHPPAEPFPDAQVTAAFALGWQVAELYRPEVHTRPPARPDDLPTLDRLTPEQRLTIALRQIDAGLARVAPAITAACLTHPDTGPLHAAFAPPPDVAARTQAVQAIHIELLSTLTAAEARLGRAYGLGRALADTCRHHPSWPALAREFDAQRIAQLRSWLDDLASLLPAHAAKSVSRSLARWEAVIHAALSPAAGSVTGPRASAPPGEPAGDLLDYATRQGELWRALLAGEKAGVDMLTVNNYLDAAGGMITNTRKVAERFMRRFWWLSILIVALFVGGILAIVLAANSVASVIAGAAGVAASAGLTWKGVGNALGGPAGALEQHVWGAELDAAIADAITLLPLNRKETGGRRRLAVDARGAGTRGDGAGASEPG
ncbi:MAG: hypothetical protein ACXVUX_08960 [Solirubrobacteraceae bacterium]